MPLKLLFRYLVISICVFLISFAGSFINKYDKTSGAGAELLPDGDDDKPAEQVYKNIQVLKGMPKKDLHMVMHFMRASLGVNCSFCHVHNEQTNEWDFANDDKEEKKRAREMITMVMGINRDYFEGFNAVSCFTCHQGHTNISRIPPLPQKPGAFKEFEKDTTLPSAQTVFDNYNKALGDIETFKYAKSRYSKGTITGFNGKSSDLEIYQAAPNKFLQIVKTPEATTTRGFDGTEGWIKDSKGIWDLNDYFLTETKSYADFIGDLDLYTRYSKLQVFSRDTLDGKTVYVVRAVIDDNRNERLYFDVSSGFLLRRKIFAKSIIGFIPEQIDYSDYRNVNNVMLPFVIRYSYVDPYAEIERRYTEVKLNVALDNISFTRP
jgi:hypothetical protein